MKIISSELYVKDNKVYHEGNKPKPKDIGAAPETHTHNYASATTPGGSAEHAIKATEDSLGQRIDKYIKGLSVSGRTITYTRGDGTTGTITTQDTNTTYSVGTASALGLTKLYTGTGTATDGTMTQNAINTALNGKANSSHTHSSLKGTVGSTIAPSTGTGVIRYDYNVLSANAGTLPNINNANGILTLSTHAGNYYSQLGFSSNGSLYYRAFNGVALDTTTAWKQVAFTNSSITGNAATATKLQTARTINGTSFDGTANITTANWGTERSLNGVSVNGSTNYTIPVENYYCTVGDNNTNLYHRILTTDIATTNWVDKSLIIVMNSGYNGGGFGIAKITFRTNDISSAANSQGEIKWLVRHRFAENALVFNFVNQAKNACMDVFYKSPGNYSGVTWYVLSEGGGRGEKHSKQWTKYNTNASGTNAYTEANMKTLRTYTSTLVSAKDAGHVSTANSASTLSTARTINGTSFNGSANITTANWGTARNIQIGNTTKSVNGSANVSWSLSEIGAAASNHTHNYAGSSSAGGAANSANLLNITGGRPTSANTSVIVGPNTAMMLSTSAMTTGKPAGDGYITEYRWDNNAGWNAQLFVPNNTTGVIQYRSMNAGTWGNWNTVYSTCNPQTTITGNAGTATKLQTARTIALGGILSGSASFDGSGNVTINATANDITTITKSLNVTTSWADTGITGSNLATGTYAVQMHINNGANTGHYNEYYSGIMSWYADGTNSTDADEILLHKAGHASNGRHVYLRTIRTGNSGRLKLQISCTHAFSAASNITFKFKKLI